MNSMRLYFQIGIYWFNEFYRRYSFQSILFSAHHKIITVHEMFLHLSLKLNLFMLKFIYNIWWPASFFDWIKIARNGCVRFVVNKYQKYTYKMNIICRLLFLLHTFNLTSGQYTQFTAHAVNGKKGYLYNGL